MVDTLADVLSVKKPFAPMGLSFAGATDGVHPQTAGDNRPCTADA